MDIPSYPNDSATIYILSPDSIVLNKFSYTDDMHFELIKDPEGVSLERILINSNNSNSNLTWHSAAENVGWGTQELLILNTYQVCLTRISLH